jgi:hypothetical protein
VVKRGDRRTTGAEPDETEQRPTKKKKPTKTYTREESREKEGLALRRSGAEEERVARYQTNRSIFRRRLLINIVVGFIS